MSADGFYLWLRAMGRSHFCCPITLEGLGICWLYEERKQLIELATGNYGRRYRRWRPVPLRRLASLARRTRVPLGDLHDQRLRLSGARHGLWTCSAGLTIFGDDPVLNGRCSWGLHNLLVLQL